MTTKRARFYLTLLGVFAAVALVLAVSGIYGVLSYAVAQRTREFGIRSATWQHARNDVGPRNQGRPRAHRRRFAFGLVGSMGATRLLETMLYGVSPLDRATWAATTLTLAVVGLLATLLPAFRATRADPLLAIRSD